MMFTGRSHMGFMLAGVLLFGVLMLSACLAGEPAVGSGRKVMDAEGERLRERVVFQIRQNYFRLPSVSCKQVTTVLDSRVAKPEVVRGETNKGSRFEYKASPKSVTEADLILARGKIRADFFRDERNEKWSDSLKDGIWTTWRPLQNFGRRKYVEELGSEVNFDPRNLGVAELKKNFLTELSRPQVVRHKTVKRSGAERLFLEVSEKIPQHLFTMTTRYEFDPARNYLPTRILAEDPISKQILSVQEIEYQEVIPEKAWFLKKSETRYFAGKKFEEPGIDGWTQKAVTEIVGPVRTGEGIDDSEFEIELPVGGNVIDQTVGRERPVEKR